MESRPLLNRSGPELIEIFEYCVDEVKVLKRLHAELIHRNTPSMRKLRDKVEKALSEFKGDSPSPGKGAAEPQPNQPQMPTGSGSIEKKERPSPRPAQDSSAKTKPGEPHPPTADEGETEKSNGPTRGKVGSIRPCGLVPGAPSRWTVPVKRDFEIEVAKNATRVEKFVAALRALIKDMRRRGSGMRTITLEHGEAVALDGREGGYRFPYDGDADLFEGAKVTIAFGKRTCDGRIVSVSTQWLIIAFDEDLGVSIGACVLRIDNTAMIETLADRLEKVQSGETKLNLKLADSVLANLEDQIQTIVVTNRPKSEGKLNYQQLRFIKRASDYAVTYLWGPPGTGKTLSLGTIIELLFNADKRVLICSNTNQAVDQVIQKLCESLERTHPALVDGRILRIGKTDGIPEKFTDYVTLEGIVRRKSMDLQKRKSVLENEILHIRTTCEFAQRILQAFKEYDESLREREGLNYQQEALKKAVSEAGAADIEVAKLIEALNLELKNYLAAGTMRRLLMRGEAKIHAEILKAQARKDSTEIQLRARRLACDDPELQLRLLDVATRQEKLKLVVRNQNRIAAQAQVDEMDKKMAPALREISEINKVLEGVEKAIVAEARIIGATVTKTYLSPQQFGNFDVVIIDEASMVMLPAIYYVSGLAKEKVIISGDPRQLSPIVPTDQEAIQEVIGQNIFQETGISKTSRGKALDRTVMLTEQYRMNEKICQMISGRMYRDELKTSKQNNVSHATPPIPFNGEMTVIDTSPIQPFVNRHGSSRYNLMNALVARNLVKHFTETDFLAKPSSGTKDESRLGICTPFAAQRDVLKRLIDGTGAVIGTVHRYQGDEKTAMIIDVPDSLGEHHVSLFAQAGSPEDDGAKLFNVAVSRAKENVIFIANLNYLDAKLPADAFLRELLYTASTKGRTIDAREILAMWPIAEDLKSTGRPFSLDPETLRSGLFKQSDFEAVFSADVEQAKKSVAIFSGFVTPQRVAGYESLFRLKLGEGIKIRCVTRPPARNGSIPVPLGRDALNGLEAMGCIVDTRWDIHEKVVIVDDEIVWFGSLNPLSNTNRTDEMMARITGKPSALQLAAFMAVTNNIDPDKAAGLSVTGENPRCPDCGCRSTYRVGSYGPFWQCEEECGWKQGVSKGNNSKKPKANEENLQREGGPCPICRSKTSLRTGPYGHFYSCSKYPECRGIWKEGGQSKTKSNGQRRPTKKKGASGFPPR